MNYYKVGLGATSKLPVLITEPITKKLSEIKETISETKEIVETLKTGHQRFYDRGISGKPSEGFLELLKDIGIALPTIGGIYSITQTYVTRKTP